MKNRTLKNLLMNKHTRESSPMKNTSMKKISKFAVLGTASLLAIASFSSFATDYSRAEKELKIMTKIFDTSISEGVDTRRGRHSYRSNGRTSATYLAKQGMVFSFNFNDSQFGNGEDWQAFGEGIGQLVGSISAEIAQSFTDDEFRIAPIAPIAPLADGDWEGNMEAYEVYQEAMEHLRDAQRDQREEVRDLQRSIRDIERQARREEVDAKKLEKVKMKLEEKMNILETKQKAYENTRKEYEEKRKEKYIASNKKRTNLITSTLCDYGATLRSLKNNEYITLIFKNYENG